MLKKCNISKINIDSSGDILANTNELGYSKNIVSNWRLKYLFLNNFYFNNYF